jgi:hypothetical protein
MLLGGARALSHASASCSGRGGGGGGAAAAGRRAAAAPLRGRAAAPPARAPRRRGPPPPRAEADDAAEYYAAALDDALSDVPRRDPDMILRSNNSAPDFSNPTWYDDVDDWSEFWSNTVMTERDMEDLMSLEDEADAQALLAAGEAAAADAAASGGAPAEDGAARLSRQRLDRAHTLIGALRDIRKQTAAIQILGPIADKPTGYHNAYEYEPGTVRGAGRGRGHEGVGAGVGGGGGGV